MKTTNNETPKQVEANVSETESTTLSTPQTPFYDGIEMYTGDKETKPLKVNMDSNEVKKFIGEHDPMLYFREGKIPTYYKQLGQLLDSDREEVQVMTEALPQFKGLLLFKHHQQSLYTILVPKSYGEFELDQQGEIRDQNVKCHTCAVAFGGNGMPPAYEKGAFKKSLAKFEKHFTSNYSRNRRG